MVLFIKNNKYIQMNRYRLPRLIVFVKINNTKSHLNVHFSVSSSVVVVVDNISDIDPEFADYPECPANRESA